MSEQAWVDETIEAGKACCGWVIKPRPVALDKVAVSPLVPAKPKKKHWWQRKATS